MTGAAKPTLLQALGDKNMIEFAPPPPMAAKYTITVFTDLDCPYCRKFHSQIAEYNAKGIAVRYVVANPSSYLWFSPERPVSVIGIRRPLQVMTWRPSTKPVALTCNRSTEEST